MLEQIKISVNRCFNFVKLQVILKSNELFYPNLKDSVIVFEKRSLLLDICANAMFAMLVALLRD